MDSKMTLREAAAQALEALIRASSYYDTYAEIAALEAALAEPVQEPVAYKDKYYESLHHQDFGNSIPLYAAPPQRKPLTEEEISNLWDNHIVPVFGKNGINPIVFARAIEAAHGIKEKT